MINFVQYPVDNLTVLQQELLEQIKNKRPDIFNIDITAQVITVAYNESTSEGALRSFECNIQEKFGKILNKTFWITGPRGRNLPHVDGTSQFCPSVKLMFPVLNCNRTLTIWFNNKGNLIYQNKTGLEYFLPSNSDLLNPIESLELLEPVMARVDILHGVYNFTKHIRIICSYVCEDRNKLLELFQQNK